MLFRVCGVTANIDDDVVQSFLNEDKFYKDSDADPDNTYDSVREALLADNYSILCYNDKYTLFGAKYKDKAEAVKIFTFELLYKGDNEGPIHERSSHENSRVLKNFDKLMLE